MWAGWRWVIAEAHGELWVEYFQCQACFDAAQRDGDEQAAYGEDSPGRAARMRLAGGAPDQVNKVGGGHGLSGLGLGRLIDQLATSEAIPWLFCQRL